MNANLKVLLELFNNTYYSSVANSICKKYSSTEILADVLDRWKRTWPTIQNLLFHFDEHRTKQDMPHFLRQTLQQQKHNNGMFRISICIIRTHIDPTTNKIHQNCCLLHCKAMCLNTYIYNRVHVTLTFDCKWRDASINLIIGTNIC